MKISVVNVFFFLFCSVKCLISVCVCVCVCFSISVGTSTWMHTAASRTSPRAVRMQQLVWRAGDAHYQSRHRPRSVLTALGLTLLATHTD